MDISYTKSIGFIWKLKGLTQSCSRLNIGVKDLPKSQREAGRERGFPSIKLLQFRSQDERNPNLSKGVSYIAHTIQIKLNRLLTDVTFEDFHAFWFRFFHSCQLELPMYKIA